MEKIVIIDENMILSSKLRTISKNQGYEPSVISFVKPNTIEKIKELNPKYVLVNLESRANNVFEIIKELKENGFKIIGYCGHTNVQLAQRAKDEGVNFVATNSSIVSHFDEIIKAV